MRHHFTLTIEDDSLESYYRAFHDLRKMFGDPGIASMSSDTHMIERQDEDYG